MQDFTAGSVTRHLLKTTSFMLVTMVFQTLYFLIDLYWVGRLGKEAVAAVAVAGNLTFVVLALSQMLGVGATTMVSHAVGRKDHDRAVMLFNQSQVLSMTSGFVFLLVCMTLRVPYSNALSADATTAALAAEYLLWFVPAMALQFGIVAMGAALRGTGNFKPSMVVQTATVILNMVLAPILIFGWIAGRPMGVAGAALSSLVAVAVGVVWLSTYFLHRGSYLHFRPRTWMPDTRIWAAMLKIGLPAGAEFALTAVYLFIVYKITQPFGASAQAGFGIGLRLIQALFLPVVALGFSAGPVAGQNVGARLPARVRTVFGSATAMAAAFMAMSAIVCNVYASELLAIFTDDPDVIRVGVEYLRIVSLTFIASGVVFVSSSMFQALGNTIPPLLTSVSRIVLIGVPVVILSRLPGFELRTIWILSAIGVVFQMIANLWLLRREFRIRFGVPELDQPSLSA
ncbi:MAG: MATE family efflux transporter [Vicinamibacterales bacterium]